MLKLIAFTIFLVASPTFGLVEDLYKTENHCYTGCQSNYNDNISNLDGCKIGCNYKLHHEKCADQCKLLAVDEGVQASCVVGCSMNHPEIKQSVEKPHLKSIIVIRLRQHSSLNSDPIKTFNNIIRKFKENSNLLEQNNEMKSVMNLIKNIPVLKSSDEDKSKYLQHIVIHQNERMDQIQNYMKNLPSKVNHFVSKQSKALSLILLTTLLITSIIISYKIILLCWKTPKHHNLSVQAHDLYLEKDVIQQDLPVKINLTNI